MFSHVFPDQMSKTKVKASKVKPTIISQNNQFFDPWNTFFERAFESPPLRHEVAYDGSQVYSKPEPNCKRQHAQSAIRQFRTHPHATKTPKQLQKTFLATNLISSPNTVARATLDPSAKISASLTAKAIKNNSQGTTEIPSPASACYIRLASVLWDCLRPKYSSPTSQSKAILFFQKKKNKKRRKETVLGPALGPWRKSGTRFFAWILNLGYCRCGSAWLGSTRLSRYPAVAD